DTATGKEVRTLRVEAEGQQPLCFALAPDGRTVAVAYFGNALRLWDVGTGAMLRLSDTAKADISCSAFSPDGHFLAGGGAGNALVWEVAPTRLVAKELSAKDLQARWAELGGDDAAAAYAALWALAAAPKQAVPLIAQHVRPIPALDDKRLARLFADLDNDSFD